MKSFGTRMAVVDEALRLDRSRHSKLAKKFTAKVMSRATSFARTVSRAQDDTYKYMREEIA